MGNDSLHFFKFFYLVYFIVQFKYSTSIIYNLNEVTISKLLDSMNIK